MNELREEVELPAIVEYFKRSEEERVAATERVCIGGKEAGIAFFTRHPHLGFSCAVHLQCELSEREEQLKSSLAANREQKAEIERLKVTNRELNRRNQSLQHSLNLEAGGPSWHRYFTAALSIIREDAGLKLELASLRASVGEKWIEIKEGCKMPMSGDRVLVYEHGTVFFAYFQSARKSWIGDLPDVFLDSSDGHFTAVTHWRPLPVALTLPGGEK